MDNDITLWLILPPLFFALGWVSARLDIRYLMEESARLPRHYFDSLRAILNQRLDVATLSLTDVLKRQPDAAQLQLALGELHRRQGQFQEAVYFHEQLQHSPSISPLVRDEAALALARDYLSAGLWDRAESAFMMLKSHAVYGNEAQGCLVEIFECSGQWQRAIEYRRLWAQRVMRSDANVLAHYHCEQAILYLAKTQPESASEELGHALAESPHSVRARLLQAEWAAQQSHFEEARAMCLDIEAHQPEAISLALPLLRRIDEALSTQSMTYQWLKAVYERHHLPVLLVPISEGALLYESYPQGILRWMFDALAEYPSPSLLKAFVQLKISSSLEEKKAPSEDATLVMHVLQGYSRRYEVYRCGTCGFVAHRHHWQCPACRTWEPFPMVPEVRS
jgi:lipopolysaccharide assembly protein B